MASVSGRATHASSGQINVVVLDADAAQRRSLVGMIDTRGHGRFSVTPCATAAEARAAVRGAPGAIVIADLDTIGGTARLGELEAHTIATSANGSLSVAVDAMRRGARDFLAKPIGAKVLIERLEATLGAAPIAPLRPPPSSDGAQFAGFVGRSPQMLAVYDRIRRIAPSRAPVFITGETGTGKELAAEAVHAEASPAERPFVAINCSAIPRDLMESEIFGHVRGAFTGATETRAGAAELAHGGTLFLDELAEMDSSLQAKLLRFVQSGTFRRVGGSETMRVDVRIISATNRDPADEIAAGRLRADLFYRLNVLPVHMAPLRDRLDDIGPLATLFLARFAAEERRGFTRFDGDALHAMQSYRWPGNVRELANAIRHAVVMHDGNAITAAMLPEDVRAQPATTTPETYAARERAFIEATLAACEGSVARAAARLGISPSTIYRKAETWRTGG
ncbi:MAG TPA: sigma-54 dependent transcriptional regulator [Bauldia sp.]|nr:sigma-54 dependent transcriptional regulator [Bauldia sp.]